MQVFRLPLLLTLVVFLFAGSRAMAQSNVEVFGKNRLQYRKFDWKYYEAGHFKIYHYDRSGRELARFLAEQAERDIAAIEKRLGGLFPERLDIMLYNSYDEYQQSNIGLSEQLQLQNDHPTGTVNLVGDKLVVYFTGKHSDLKTQLRQGMAKVVMERLLLGENFRELVKNAVLLNLPLWASSGYVDYVVDGWTSDDDNDWKNQIIGRPSAHFESIAENNPRLAGKAFWKYIAVKHGEKEIQSLLFLAQQKSSLNKAVKANLHQKLKPTCDSVIAFYKERYAVESTLFQPLDTADALIKIPIPDKDTRIRDIKVSPRGGDVAYVEWKFGEFKVILERTRVVDGVSKKEKSVLISGGVKNHEEFDDPDYPILSWNNTGFKLGIIIKSKDRLRVRVYNSVKAKLEDFRIPQNKFDRITSFTFMEDDDVIVLSALKKGQSDLFEYRLKGSKLVQLTDDAWDDLDPVFVSGGARKGIVFLSNRPTPHLNIRPLPNELPIGPMNAFFYFSTTKSYDLLQLSNIKKGQISEAIPYGSDYYSYLSDESGIRSRYVVLFARDRRNMDSAYAVPMTNFSNGILYQQYNPASGKIAATIQKGNIYYVFFQKIEIPRPFGPASPANLVPLTFVDGIATSKGPAIKEAPVGQGDSGNRASMTAEGEKRFELKESNDFKTEYSGEDKTGMARPGQDSYDLADKLAIKGTKEGQSPTNDSLDKEWARLESTEDGKRVLYVDSTYMEMRSSPYSPSFKADFFSVRLDNSVLFNRYQSYGNNGGRFSSPPLGGMLMVSLVDKMEDYRLTGGIRLPVDFSGHTYFAQFENFRRRVDWGLIFMRQVNKYNYSFIVDPMQPPFVEPGKAITTIGQASVSYPMDKVKSFRLHFGARQDEMVIKAKDPVGLVLPNTREYWAMSRAEFVYDDTKNPTLNIWNGLRYKLYAEYMYKLYTNNDLYSISDSFQFVKKGGFYNVGFDFRYYHKIYKNAIAAIKVAGAHAGGNQQIIYFLGGVDNDINPKYSDALKPTNKNNYAFQSLATNLRGYDQNARNGNTYALINAEVRLPVLTTFLRRPIQAPILKHFQLVGFLDIGSAWEGLFPSSKNLQRYYNLTWPASNNPTVSLTVPSYFDSGIAVGYGIGARTEVLGYFARFDAAWNIRREFSWYFSLGTDF